MKRRDFLKIIGIATIAPFGFSSGDSYRTRLQKAIKKHSNVWWKPKYLKKGAKPTTFNPDYEYGTCVYILKSFEKLESKEQDSIIDILARNVSYSVPPEYRKNVDFIFSGNSGWKCIRATAGWIYRRTG